MSNQSANKMVFKPLPSKRAFEEICDQIKEGIRAGILRPEDRLPSERELARQFNVGRPAVREALRVLEDSGYIYVKQGSSGGSFIQSSEPIGVTNTMKTFVIRENITIQEITEARLAVELGVLELIVNQISRDKFKQIEENIERTLDLLQQGCFPSFTQANFHVALVDLTGNPILKTYVKSLITVLAGFIKEGKPEPKYFLSHIQYHRDILNAILGKDLEKAKKIMREHILNVGKNLTEAIEQENK